MLYFIIINLSNVIFINFLLMICKLYVNSVYHSFIFVIDKSSLCNCLSSVTIPSVSAILPKPINRIINRISFVIQVTPHARVWINEQVDNRANTGERQMFGQLRQSGRRRAQSKRHGYARHIFRAFHG